MQIHEDKWLASVLGMPCFALQCQDAGVSRDDVSKSVCSTSPTGRAFWYTKVVASNISTTTHLARAGFDLVDTNVVLERPSRPWANVAGTGGDVACGLAALNDADEIAELAAHCFRYSRFHADRRLTHGQADEIKRQWARNACLGRSPEVYVARASNSVVGFLAPVLASSPAGTTAVIDLIGVAPSRQGSGVGQALSEYFISRWAGKSIGLRVGTQIANVPALRLYEKLGFRITSASHVLHGHSHDGRLAQ